MRYSKKRLRVRFDHDFFRCTSCGYTVRIRVLGDTCKCRQCGGTMVRT